jgi:hypothetical protein
MTHRMSTDTADLTLRAASAASSGCMACRAPRASAARTSPSSASAAWARGPSRRWRAAASAADADRPRPRVRVQHQPPDPRARLTVGQAKVRGHARAHRADPPRLQGACDRRFRRARQLARCSLPANGPDGGHRCLRPGQGQGGHGGLGARHARDLFITVGAAGGKRLAHKVDIDDLSLVTHDPLLAHCASACARARRAARGQEDRRACVFSREAWRRPMRPAPSKATARSTATATARWSA